jgi:hypothetical protein
MPLSSKKHGENTQILEKLKTLDLNLRFDYWYGFGTSFMRIRIGKATNS